MDNKTLKAYKIDLNQYVKFCTSSQLPDYLSRNSIEQFLTFLHKQYKPKTAKRKIASMKAFFHYLEYVDILPSNPFSKLDIRFREPKLLPRTIPGYVIQLFLNTMYLQKEQATTEYQKRCCIRDIAVIELLFATGMRISELCNLKPIDIDFINNTVLIYGKRAKERILQIGNTDVLNTLLLY